MSGLSDLSNSTNLFPEPEGEDAEDKKERAWEPSGEALVPDASTETPLPPFSAHEIDDNRLLQPPDQTLLPAAGVEETIHQTTEPSSAETAPRHIYKISSAEADLADYMLPPQDEPIPEEGPSVWKTVWAVTREVGETIILTLIIFFLIQTVVRNFRVVGTSMLNNLHDGQYLIIDKLTYSYLFSDILDVGGPQRGDVVVFEPPNRPDDDYVKRVIGLPGETVEIINGKVLINGQPLDEPFQPVSGTYSSPPQVVPEDQIYVLGDNRNNSNDSHTWGSLPVENIVGRAWLSYWPPELWGVIPRDAPTEEATLKHFFSEMLTPSVNAEGQ